MVVITTLKLKDNWQVCPRVFDGAVDRVSFSEETCKSFECLKFEYSTEPDKRAELWKARHNAWYAAQALKPGCKVCSVSSKKTEPKVLNDMILICRVTVRMCVFQSVLYHR